MHRSRHTTKIVNIRRKDSMKDFDQIEYEQTSQDWRHRDVLTWQLPSVLVIVGGILVARAFDLSKTAPPWIKNVLLGFTAFLALCLTVALLQNLNLQNKNVKNLKLLSNEKTQRFNFRMTGSWLFFALSLLLCIFLICLFFFSLVGKI